MSSLVKFFLFFIMLSIFSPHLFADAQDDAITQTNQFSEQYLDFKESILDKLEFGKLGLSERIELLKTYDAGKKSALEKSVSDIKAQWGDINGMDSNIDAVINPASDRGLPRAYISLRTITRNIENGFERMKQLRNSFAPKLIKEIDMTTMLTRKRDGFGFDELNPNLYAGQLEVISSIVEDVSQIEKSIEDFQSSLEILAERRIENIESARFPESHVAITAGDPDELADSIKQWFKESPGWGQKAENPYDILAVAITRDWAVMKRSILNETI